MANEGKTQLLITFVATPEKVEPWKQDDPGVAKADATSGLRLTW